MPNVVQAEFFHVISPRTATLGDLFRECSERVRDGLELAAQGIECGSRIKTTVRFLDHSGEFTKIATRIEHMGARKEQTLTHFKQVSGWRRWWLDKRCRSNIQRITLLKEYVTRLAAQRVQMNVHFPYALAMEKPDRSFRFIRSDEVHEIVEAVADTCVVWLFIFEPNHLLADSNKLVACVM